MILKEAFRYQTFLDRILNNILNIDLRSKSIKAIKVHKMHESNPDVEDKEEVVIAEDNYTVDDIVDLLEVLCNEKEKLSIAIEQAKAGAGINIDSALAANKYRQGVAGILKLIQAKLPKSMVSNGVGRKFNVEGNQVNYYYDIETTYEDNFDRSRTNKLMKGMIKRSDEVSAEIDSAMVNTEVDYTPIFDVNDSLDDIIEEYLASK